MSLRVVSVKVPRNLLPHRNSPAVKEAVRALSVFAVSRLTELAQQRLKRTAQAYLRGVTSPSAVTVTDRGFELHLVGAFANAIENGSDAYDLKKMLKGRPYVDIPFSHNAPGSTKNPMPKADFATLGGSIKAAQRLLLKSGVKPEVVAGMPFRGPRVMPTGPQTKRNEFGNYKHKASIYGSMLRTAHVYNKATQYTYKTFRRMSVNSDPASWIHPGLAGVKLFPIVAGEVQALAPRVLLDAIKKVL